MWRGGLGVNIRVREYNERKYITYKGTADRGGGVKTHARGGRDKGGINIRY
jgi:hypothetical protein